VTQTPGQGEVPRPPRVVLFRANAIDADSRAKKFALTLARLGYEVHVLSAEEQGAPTEDRWLGPVRVHPVIMTHALREVTKLKLGHRRRRQFRVIDWTPTDEYVTQVAELRRLSRETRRRSDALRSPEPRDPIRHALWRPKWLVLRLTHSAAKGLLVGRRARWRAQWVVNVSHRTAWRAWDKARQSSTVLATTRGVLPEVEDYAASFGKVLDALQPDIVHAHHPLVLGTAVRVARRRRAFGGDCAVIYDARENFAGIPAAEQGNVRRHHVLVREEARYIRDAAAVMTVSEPIADVLKERYDLPDRPTVVLNVPVNAPQRTSPAAGTVREAAGLPAGTPLIVYSGAVSGARGIDVLIDAMALLPDVHLALVTVPFPHPRTQALLDRAAETGSAGRIHPLPPVGQDELLHYLSGADVAVHPMPGGSPNHDQAMPNKLFEYLHAGLPLVVADAKLMADFVRRNELGEVFRSGDARGLAEAVTRLLASDRARPSREELAARYSWQAQEALIAQLYAGVAPVPQPWHVDPSALPPAFPDLRVTAERTVAVPEPVPEPVGAGRPVTREPAPEVEPVPLDPIDEAEASVLGPEPAAGRAAGRGAGRRAGRSAPADPARLTPVTEAEPLRTEVVSSATPPTSRRRDPRPGPGAASSTTAASSARSSSAREPSRTANRPEV
jgi:glycosyltransferase involved in cell wall biosynthesis